MNKNRKTYLRIKDIPDDILHQLNTGQIQSITLAEFLAIDLQLFLKTLFPEIKNVSEIDKARPFTFRLKKASELIFERYEDTKLDFLQNHQSDMARTLACGIISLIPNLTISQRLKKIKPLANDNSAVSVKENAWWFLRAHIEENLSEVIDIFAKFWVNDKSANIRRYASESTRPRGVWCKHINILKKNPQIALPILQPLYADESKYVQDSVANWLNDASKDSPQFVIDLCEDFRKKSSSPNTLKIIKRAMRTIKKPNF